MKKPIPIDFRLYQEHSKNFVLNSWDIPSILYFTLGLTNEGGEVAGKIKKIFRDQDGEIDDEIKEKIKHELGDVLWYLSQIATELNISLDEIAIINLQKLEARSKAGTLKGEGDNR